MAEIKIEKLGKRYDNGALAVSDFNLNIQDEEFIVFVGPSGCGKSTTLRMIAGLEEITEGEFFIDGKLMNEVQPKERDIAMVFQNYALYPHMTVYENIAFGLQLRKFKKAEIKRRVNEAAAILGLEDYLDRKPKALSGGQRQRVALGRAIVRDAKVFLMDEPLSNLDAKLRVQMRAEIVKLHRRLKTTTIYVTHDQTEAMTMASRIVIMKDGLIQQVGSPKEVYNFPENRFVGSFIGSPAMNFFEGRIDKGRYVMGDKMLDIPPQMMEMLKNEGYEGKSVTLGIRPEHIHVNNEDLSNIPTSEFEAVITVSELTGAETILHAVYAEQEFIARVEATTTIEPGHTATLAFDMAHVHFFDDETGNRIKAVEFSESML
ncbi:sn-glycerol-3-phosphate ABC transporter ATP-binding protein UgpC [Microbacterium sp. APC 3898]|uniref:Sn-glycerol-3-phosphate ABC transporter ATP-binding protein UgpC n=2 Tax=Planococcus TaxID=1372 RepID=A0ABT7ZK55_9BACL|nr:MULTISPECIES: sn-glycerol-3-phosphate ABC transporter ATP-binding protein UgpC [Terrabacteria group]MBD8014658.1 sn-glycerol-3-phosphate ABC transporter ATP-binding protein UgpC [Planococcus wigleyi]MDN3427529.1 sn-glycerol-3-phosphate ABC transporter ATP-binding protein UgpC [Planococcus sp. APC 4016]MDN3436884.1 sn-glycerol-3-phosphate ABC transporter ATP-binding protein UgpC [Planococcus sp. APC 3900]MDN3499080.1 sn-glycerol-3-phosphate ABC transporter ATP-binding protein UgpC [Microbacte